MAFEQAKNNPQESPKVNEAVSSPDAVKYSKEQGRKVVDSAHNSMELAEQEPKEKARIMCHQKIVDGIAQFRKVDDSKQTRAQRLEHAFQIVRDSLQSVMKDPDFPGAQYLPQSPDNVRSRLYFLKEDEVDGNGDGAQFTVHPDSSGQGGYRFEVASYAEHGAV